MHQSGIEPANDCGKSFYPMVPDAFYLEEKVTKTIKIMVRISFYGGYRNDQ